MNIVQSMRLPASRTPPRRVSVRRFVCYRRRVLELETRLRDFTARPHARDPGERERAQLTQTSEPRESVHRSHTHPSAPLACTARHAPLAIQRPQHLEQLTAQRIYRRIRQERLRAEGWGQWHVRVSRGGPDELREGDVGELESMPSCASQLQNSSTN